MYNITQKFISYNRSHESLSPQGIVLHATDDKGATANNEFNYFNTGNRKASAHAFIDWTDIIETIPDNEVAWGSGYTSNHRYLQVELCEPATHDESKFNEVWNRAVWYFAYKLVNKIKINTVSKDNILSHAEISAKWHETTHNDPIDFFSEYGKTVDQFREEVQSMINTINNVERIVNSMQIKDVQHVCNVLGIRDYEGKSLDEDNLNGKRTESSRQKLKEILTYILR